MAEERPPLEPRIEDECPALAARVPAYGLDRLLANVTDENRHDETDWGRAVGVEEW